MGSESQTYTYINEMLYFLSKILMDTLSDLKNNQSLKVFQKLYLIMKKKKMRIIL